MSINVWIFAFNELCDLKNLKKLISGSCPRRVIQSCINNLKKIYIYEHDLHKMQCDVHIFLLIFFALYNYLLFFESDHIQFQHRFKHIFVHVKKFFLFFQKLKNQRYPFEEDTSICDVCIFKNFLAVYF